MSKEIEFQVTTKIAKILKDPESLHKVLVPSVKEVAGLAVKEYKDQMPTLTGFGKHSVKEYRNGDLDYTVTSKRTEKGRPYLIYLHEGTGKLRGARDFGYHTGRVKAGDVARGIGGIRPNKFAKRAYERLQARKVGEYVLRNNIDKLIKQ